MTAARAEAPPSPFANMRFRVEIDGMAGTGALEVIFPEARVVAQPPKPRAVRYGALIVKRGLTTSRDWYEWWDTARRARRPPKRSVRILLLDEAGIETGGWLFEEATPVAYQLSPLNALGNEPVIETLELAVGGLEALAPPDLARGRGSST
jgi:T4-like virus tail tube protein gp19